MDRINEHEDDVDLGAARVETKGDLIGNSHDEDRQKVAFGLTDD